MPLPTLKTTKTLNLALSPRKNLYT